MDWTLEVVVVPVADVDRAIAFYGDGGGSISTTTPMQGLSASRSSHPPDPDVPSFSVTLLRCRRDRCGVSSSSSPTRIALATSSSRSVAADAIQVIDERDGGTMFGFTDPDGNEWVVQEIRARADPQT